MKVTVALLLVLSLLHSSSCLECYNCYTAYRRHEGANDTDRRLNYYESTLEDYNNTDAVPFADPWGCQWHECESTDSYCRVFKWMNWEVEKKKGWNETDRYKWVTWEYRGCHSEAMRVYDNVKNSIEDWLSLPYVQQKYNDDDKDFKQKPSIVTLEAERGYCDMDLCNGYPKAKLTELSKSLTAVITFILVAGLPSMFLYDWRYGDKDEEEKKAEEKKEEEETPQDNEEEGEGEEPAQDNEPEEEGEEPAQDNEPEDEGGEQAEETPQPVETEDGVEMQEMQAADEADQVTADQPTDGADAAPDSTNESPAEPSSAVPVTEPSPPAADQPKEEAPVISDVQAQDVSAVEDPSVESRDNEPLLGAPQSASSPAVSTENVSVAVIRDSNNVTMDDSTFDPDDASVPLL